MRDPRRFTILLLLAVGKWMFPACLVEASSISNDAELSAGESAPQDNDFEDDETFDVRVSADCAATLLAGGGLVGGALTSVGGASLLSLMGLTSGGSLASWLESTLPLMTDTKGGLVATLQSVAATKRDAAATAENTTATIVIGSALGGRISAAYLEEFCGRVDEEVQAQSVAGHLLSKNSELVAASLQNPSHADQTPESTDSDHHPAGGEAPLDGETYDVRVSADCASALLVGGGLIGGALTSVGGAPLLSLLGYTSGGSWTSWWQSTLPLLITRGGLLATLQSVATSGRAAVAGTYTTSTIVVGSAVGGRTSATYLQDFCGRVDEEVRTQSVAGQLLSKNTELVAVALNPSSYTWAADKAKETTLWLWETAQKQDYQETLNQAKETSEWLWETAQKQDYQEAVSQAKETSEWLWETAQKQDYQEALNQAKETSEWLWETAQKQDYQGAIKQATEKTQRLWETAKNSDVVTSTLNHPDVQNVVDMATETTQQLWETAKNSDVLSSTLSHPDVQNAVNMAKETTEQLWETAKNSDVVSSTLNHPDVQNAVNIAKDTTEKLWETAKNSDLLTSTLNHPDVQNAMEKAKETTGWLWDQLGQVHDSYVAQSSEQQQSKDL